MCTMCCADLTYMPLQAVHAASMKLWRWSFKLCMYAQQGIRTLDGLSSWLRARQRLDVEAAANECLLFHTGPDIPPAVDGL